MDWDLAIKRNSKALKGIIEVLFALLGLDGTDAASRIPRSLHSAVLLRLMAKSQSIVVPIPRKEQNRNTNDIVGI